MQFPSISLTHKEEQVFALATLFRFAVHARKELSIEDISQIELSTNKCSEKHKIKLLRGITRIGSSYKLDDDGDILILEELVNIVLHKYRINLPSSLRRTADVGGLRLFGCDGVPKFIDVSGLTSNGRYATTRDAIINQYAGCWRVFRPSTTSRDGHVVINRSFLNIKPKPALESESKIVSEFSISQRANEPGSDGFHVGLAQSNTKKVTGIVTLSDGDFVVLIGERDSIDRIGYLALMTWKRHQPDEFSKEHFLSGLSILPNSTGNQIASFFVASFIKESDTFDKSMFEETRNKEYAQLGSFPWETLKETMQRSESEGIEKMIEISKHNLVFLCD